MASPTDPLLSDRSAAPRGAPDPTPPRAHPELLERAWRRTDALFALVRPAALRQRPIGQRNPLVFYVGHLPAFTWNLLGKGVLGRGASSFAAFDRLFDFGIDPEEGAEPASASDWPALDLILRYRDHVRAFVRGAADELAQRAREDVLAEGGRILHLVLEHELMHHETLLYMLHELDRAQLVRPAWAEAPVLGASAPELAPARVEAGNARLGAAFDAIPFGWDNEFPARDVRVEAFALERVPVTLERFAAFVDGGGYEDARAWSPEGFAWARKHALACPKDWFRRDGRWHVRTLFDDVPLDLVAAWPASVSWAEADAFARRSGARLPSEPELVRAAYGDDPARAFPWSDGADSAPRERNVPSPRNGAAHEPPSAARPSAPPPVPGAAQDAAALDGRGNFGFRHLAPTPVGRYPAGASPCGALDLLGNGWDWTATRFERHDGFDAYVKSYPGYSADFFDGAHRVLLGGSWATADALLRRSFRNWFRFNYPYPFTQFRLARNA